MHDVDVDIHDLLADHQAIAIVWDISHVKDQRPDLTEEQAWQVLQAIEHDRFNDPMLETIRHVADNLYPIGKESLRRRIKSLLGEVEALPDREADDPAAYGEAAAKLDAIEMNVKGRKMPISRRKSASSWSAGRSTCGRWSKRSFTTSIPWPAPQAHN